jgi:hypothetical protein
MPAAITRFGGEIIDPRRGWSVTTGALRAYPGEALRGRGRGLTDLARQAPDLTVTPPAP